MASGVSDIGCVNGFDPSFPFGVKYSHLRAGPTGRID